MNRTDHAAAIIRYAIAMYASVGSSSCGLALERFTALLLEALVSVGCGIEGGDFEQRTEQDGLVDRAQAGLVGELADAALFPFLALGQLLLEVLDVGQGLGAVFPACHDVPPGWCVLFWRALA